ncbi:MAG: PspA-associated protein PspAA [Solirubrobacteraceae bacterium]
MIVRISTEGQYELTESDAEVLNELDNQAVAACEAGDREGFSRTFNELIEFVRKNGQPVSEDSLDSSDVILPPPDVSFEEAQAEFSGEGLIPG